MSEIDRQRVRGVEVLREMDFTWRNGRWLPPVSAENQPACSGGRCHVSRACGANRQTGGLRRDSDDEEELLRIGEAIESYEAIRWPKQGAGQEGVDR